MDKISSMPGSVTYMDCFSILVSHIHAHYVSLSALTELRVYVCTDSFPLVVTALDPTVEIVLRVI